MEILFKKRKKKKEQRKKIILCFLASCLLPLASFSQEKIQDTTKVNPLDEVLVSGVRASKKKSSYVYECD